MSQLTSCYIGYSEEERIERVCHRIAQLLDDHLSQSSQEILDNTDEDPSIVDAAIERLGRRDSYTIIHDKTYGKVIHHGP